MALLMACALPLTAFKSAKITATHQTTKALFTAYHVGETTDGIYEIYADSPVNTPGNILYVENGADLSIHYATGYTSTSVHPPITNTYNVTVYASDHDDTGGIIYTGSGSLYY